MILEECAKSTGVSLQNASGSNILILEQPDGNGTITFYPLFPGISMSYISVRSATWPVPDLSCPDEFFVVNYSAKGRCELGSVDMGYVYVDSGDFSLSRRFAQPEYSEYFYPRRYYDGVELFIDISIANAESPYLADAFGIDLHGIMHAYCPGETAYVSAPEPGIHRACESLWSLCDARNPGADTRRKLLAAELLTDLTHGVQPYTQKPNTILTPTQVEIAKQAERLLMADLREHIAARELAERFSVSETSLKNYFKGVFGENISVYMQEARMKKGAELLGETKMAVSEIAEQVGYASQGRFAIAFKRRCSVSPLEYRRKRHLDDRGNAGGQKGLLHMRATAP